jgi:2-oxoisovalerate dehydrogenase E2 component (dihydrolipoyl transacylase)
MMPVEIKLPDVGEGIAEAEIVEILVHVGERVRADQPLLAVMTDKATVEIPAPVDGIVTWLSATVGARVAIGTHIITLSAVEMTAPHSAMPTSASTNTPSVPAPAIAHEQTAHQATVAQRPLAAPSVRQSARTAGVALESVTGTGPGGRILHADLARDPASEAAQTAVQDDGVDSVPVVGLRRVIAERLQDTKRRIPHFTYVEEVDVTELEALRLTLNRDHAGTRPKLSLLPFLARSLVRVLPDFADLNARFDDRDGVLHRHRAVHLGIATQTPRGLMVPVVRQCETLDLFGIARSVAVLAEAARDGSIAREDLTGSTITITSLGALGGIVTTPVLNSPEVAIIGVNRIVTRPVWRNGHVEPRQIMNLSSSFDHRIVDGFVAAEFVQAIRKHLEHPAQMFLDA